MGLTGGIGSGKSEVARLLARLGAVVIDSDQLAREVVAPGTPGLQAVVEAFGEEFLNDDGTLARDRLGTLVFGDPEARQRLNAIVHPLVGVAAVERANSAPPDAIVVQDVPLLVEAGLTEAYDIVVVVDAPDEVRLDRLVDQRGMAREDAVARMAAQATREERLAAADHVIVNDGSLGDLEGRVSHLWAMLQSHNGPDATDTVH